MVKEYEGNQMEPLDVDECKLVIWFQNGEISAFDKRDLNIKLSFLENKKNDVKDKSSQMDGKIVKADQAYCDALLEQYDSQDFEAFHCSLYKILTIAQKCNVCQLQNPMQECNPMKPGKEKSNLLLLYGNAIIINLHGQVIWKSKTSSRYYLLEGNRCCSCAHIPNNRVPELVDDDLNFDSEWKSSALRCNIEKTNHNYLAKQTFDKVFVLSQVYGNEYSHFLLETLPRLYPHLDFLQQNLDVYIHVSKESNLKYPKYVIDILELFHISKQRLISGEIIAKSVYLPSHSYCGVPSNVIHHVTQVSNRILNELKIRDKYNNAMHLTDNTRKILLLERHYRRAFDRSSLEMIKSEILNKFDNKNGNRVHIFSDSDLLLMRNFTKQVEMFFTSDIIIGQHGAGLSNIIFMNHFNRLLQNQKRGRRKILIEYGPSSPPFFNTPSEYADLSLALGMNYMYLTRNSCQNSTKRDSPFTDEESFEHFKPPEINVLLSAIEESLADIDDQ